VLTSFYTPVRILNKQNEQNKQYNLVSMAMPACVAMRVWNAESRFEKLMRKDRRASTFLYLNVYGLTRNIYSKNIVDYLFNQH
jgi:hypothetical protein